MGTSSISGELVLMMQVKTGVRHSSSRATPMAMAAISSPSRARSAPRPQGCQFLSMRVSWA
jgi:hypothetical protein